MVVLSTHFIAISLHLWCWYFSSPEVSARPYHPPDMGYFICLVGKNLTAQKVTLPIVAMQSTAAAGRFIKGGVSRTRGSEGIWQSNINLPIAIAVFILDSAADGLAS